MAWDRWVEYVAECAEMRERLAAAADLLLNFDKRAIRRALYRWAGARRDVAPATSIA